jgi:hypothetical protein
MEIWTQIIVALSFYKAVSLLVGLLLAYMGYKLFKAGVWGEAGDVEAHFQDNKLVVKRAAPGTFFAILGAIIICFTIFKGMELEGYNSNQPKLID